MSDSLGKYPRGQIGHGSGALVEVENVKLTNTTNTKLKHTLARSPSGYTTGTREAMLSFKMNVGESGPERDFWSALESQTVQGFRLLLPGGLTFRITGVTSKFDIDVPLDDAVSVELEFPCKAQKV